MMKTSDLHYFTSDVSPEACYKGVKQLIFSQNIFETSRHHLLNIILKSDLIKALNIFNYDNLIIR